MARALAELVMVLHFAVLAFLVLGGFLAWRWRGLIYPHLAMATWAVLSLTFPVTCPLTAGENFFRERGGMPVLETGFIDHYIDGVLYPHEAALTVQLVLALVVLASWAGYFLDRRTGPHRVGAH